MSRQVLFTLCFSLLTLSGCGCSRNRPDVIPPTLDTSGREATTAQPAQATSKAPYVVTAEDFFRQVSKNDMKAAYALLTDHYKSLVSEADFAGLFSDIAIKSAQTVNSASSANVGYVILAVSLAKPITTGPDVTGYSVLLKKDGEAWKVALLLSEEKLAGTYNDLLILPTADNKGYVVTYSDENGKQTQFNLQEP